MEEAKCHDLMILYIKFNKQANQNTFLRNCQQNNVIPRGLRLKFILANGSNEPTLVEHVQNIMNEASSRLLDELLQYGEYNMNEKLNTYCDLRDELSPKLVNNVKISSCGVILAHKASLQHKISRLVADKDTEENFVARGSRTVFGNKYIKRSDVNIVRTLRPHRKSRQKASRKRILRGGNTATPQTSRPTEEDIDRLNPEVMADNVILSDTDKKVLRMSDKFAMTPRTPLDVCDMTIGTFNWAESLRWTYFWYHWKLGKNKDKAGYDDLDEEDQQAYEKKPWSLRTDRPAPHADADTENFISKCMDEFLDPKNRKKIKSNFSKDEWKSATKLRNLPLTHNAACRFADKSSKTIITDLSLDDDMILRDLNDEHHYDTVASDPTPKIKRTINNWTVKWKGVLDDEQTIFVNNIEDTGPGKIKPLIKTHKQQPWPLRLLLSGTNTPVQPLSKFVQFNIRHLTAHLPHQILDTKAFLQKISRINQTVSPLPSTFKIVICDVAKLYPSVNNLMGVPAVRHMLNTFPSPYLPLTDCIIEALQICLDCNVCKFQTGDGKTHIRIPNRGTAMGPCHACDYADIFMGVLDKKTVEQCPVPLLTSLDASLGSERALDWSRFRDDGITFLHQDDVEQFEQHLQGLHPDISWEVESGNKMNYLNLTVQLIDGEIHTDEFSKSSHSYLSPDSCHPPSTFKGLIYSKGRQLRMNCSKSQFLAPRLKEYAGYFAACRWNEDFAYRELCRGANFQPKETEEEARAKREDILYKPRQKKPKKIAWVTQWDPRAPDKAKIIRNNTHLLFRNLENLKIFPRGGEG